VKAHESERLKLKYDQSHNGLLQFCYKFAFNFNLRRYNLGVDVNALHNVGRSNPSEMSTTSMSSTSTSPHDADDASDNSASQRAGEVSRRPSLDAAAAEAGAYTRSLHSST
jgi:hypothetical protein